MVPAIGNWYGQLSPSPGGRRMAAAGFIPRQQDSQSLMDSADSRIAFSEIVSALSFALDLTEDAVPGHAVRSCLLGMRIGLAIGLNNNQLSDLYYALLLKDIGCSSNAARMCQILGGDDRRAKREVKTVDWTRPTAAGIRLAWNIALPGASRPRRIRRLVDRKSTRLNSSHLVISYAVFCLKK